MRLLAFSPLRLSTFVCICLRLLAFAFAPLCRAPRLRAPDCFQPFKDSPWQVL